MSKKMTNFAPEAGKGAGNNSPLILTHKTKFYGDRINIVGKGVWGKP